MEDGPSPVAAWVCELRLHCKDNYVAVAVAYSMGFEQHMVLDPAVVVDTRDDGVGPFCVLQGQPLVEVGCCNCYGDNHIPHSGDLGGSHATIEDPVECQSRK